MKKPKFRPEITRVKLNPEQAVLECNCIDGNVGGAGKRGTLVVCYQYAPGEKRHPTDICISDPTSETAVS